MAKYGELVEGLRTALSEGDDDMASRFAEALNNKEYEEESSTAATMAQAIGQGTTFGFADEAGAALRTVLDPVVGGIAAGVGAGGYKPTSDGRKDNFWGRMRDYQENFTAMGERTLGESYEENLDSQRAAVETARREDPKTFMAAELASGIASGGVAGVKSAVGQTVKAGMGRLAGTGALMGGASGYGNSEYDPLAALAFEDTDKLREEILGAAADTAKGAATGAAVSTAIPAGGVAARGLTRLIAKPFTRNATITNEAHKMVMQSLQDDIQNGFIKSTDELRDIIAKTPGMTLADAGPAMRELTESLVQRGGPAGQEMGDFLTTRNIDQYKRIFPRLSEALGADDNFGAARRTLAIETQERANEAYKHAEAIPIRMSSDMVEIMNNPEFSSALSTANRLRRAQGKPPMPEMPKVGQMVSTKEIDQILQGMDDVVSHNFKEAPAVARAVTKPLREKFKEMIYVKNPALKRARDQYGSDRLRDEAMDKGLRVLRDDADITDEVVSAMSEGEKTFFRIGAMRAVARKLLGKSDSSDLTKGIFDNPRSRDAVRTAFGSDAQFKEFMDFVAQENQMFKTFQQATGNSATARRLMSQSNEHIGRAASLIGFGSTGSLLVGATAKRAAQGVADAVVPQARRAAAQNMRDGVIANVLKQGGDVSSLMQQIQTPATVGGLLSSGVPNSAALAAGAMQPTGLLQPGVEYGGN